jgi:peptidoglycan/LPS O-acetylase OafA/YrhL
VREAINDSMILLIPISLLVLGLISEKSAVSTILASNIFGVLGEASFACYLIHADPI